MKYNVDTEIKSTRTGELVTIEYPSNTCVEMAYAEVIRPDNNQNIVKHEESCCDTL